MKNLSLNRRSFLGLTAYIVFCAVNVNVLASGSTTSALIAYAMNILDVSRAVVSIENTPQGIAKSAADP
jgi:hypothetical protein